MEEADALMGGVRWELLFFAEVFFLGFCLRMSYEILWIFRRLVRHRHFFITLEDFCFWLTGSILMFGLLFKENNGTPRLFAIFGVLIGMGMCHLGPGRLFRSLFNLWLSKIKALNKIFRNFIRKVLKKGKKKGTIEPTSRL